MVIKCYVIISFCIQTKTQIIHTIADNPQPLNKEGPLLIAPRA